MELRGWLWLSLLAAGVVLVVARRGVLIPRARERARLACVLYYLVLWLPRALGLLTRSGSDWAVVASAVWPIGFNFGLSALWHSEKDRGIYFYRSTPEAHVAEIFALAVGLAIAWAFGGFLQKTWIGREKERSARVVLTPLALYALLFLVNLAFYFAGLWSGLGLRIE